jgi:cell division protein ZapA
MAQVVVKVNGRAYTMQCNDGEEAHLAELGELLDAEIDRIKHAVGQVGDVRLLLMAGLVVADKLADALKRIEDLEAQMRPCRPRATARSGTVRSWRRRWCAPRRRGAPAGGHGAQPAVQSKSPASDIRAATGGAPTTVGSSWSVPTTA